jgi:hypothetical protein
MKARNYLEPAFYSALNAPIIGERLEFNIGDDALDSDYRVTHIDQAQQYGPPHVRKS